jgi:hypothetical protein
MQSEKKQGRVRKAPRQFLTNREKQRRHAQEQRRFERKLLIVAAVVVALALLAGGFYSLCSTAFFYTRADAVTAGSHKVTPVEYNYFFEDTYNSFCSTYSDSLSLMFDTTQPLAKQFYDKKTGETWAEYFRTLTLQAIRQTYALCDEADAKGFSDTQEIQKKVDDAVYYIGMYAKYYKFDSSDAYLVSCYGKGASVETYREYARVTKLADAYGAEYKDSLSFSEDELESYYRKNTSLFDTVTYRCYAVSVKSGDTVDLAASKKLAQSIADGSAGDEDRFCQLVLQNTDDPEFYSSDDRTIRSNFSYSNAPDTLAAWLFDGSRKAGDTTIAKNGDNGYWVAYYLSRNTHDYTMVNIRSFCSTVSDFSNATAVREAKSTVQGLLDDYANGAQTEDAFAALVDQNGGKDGGLQKNVYQGQLAEALNDWCYSTDRKPGDTAMLQGKDGFYALYFVGSGDNCRLDTVREALQQNAYQQWYDKLSAAEKFSTNWFGMKFAASEPLSSSGSASSSNS